MGNKYLLDFVLDLYNLLYFQIFLLKYSWFTMLCCFQVYSKVIKLYLYIFFQTFFPYKLLQNVEYSSLCYTIGPCWLSILYIVVCLC